jgi:hypothetical protein
MQGNAAAQAPPRPAHVGVGLRRTPFHEHGVAEPQELVQKISDADTQRFNGPDEVLQAVQGR